jgi:predicted small lipoprotein YifL
MPRVKPCLLPLILAAGLLSGCGNKGPLVLPDQQQAKPKKAHSATPAQEPRKSEGAKAAARDSGSPDGRH